MDISMKYKSLLLNATVLFILLCLSTTEICAQNHWENPDSTISIVLPVVSRAWESNQPASVDTITIPNYRPIYALLLSGYATNINLDEMIFYNLSKHLLSKGVNIYG